MEGFFLDPVIFSLGPIQVRWYGLMYVIGFFIGGQIVKKLGKEGFFSPGPDKVDSLVMHMLIGLFIGARVLYVFVYNWDYYSHNLMDLFAVWKGGLSFHGGVLGMYFGALIFAKKNSISFWEVADTVVLSASQGIFFGRMGNFINGELYGRVTDSAFGVIFKNGGPYPRHPSQLYEGVMEGLVPFITLFLLRKKFPYYGMASGIFLGAYAVFRYCIEFFREPDSQLGYYFGGTTTMGQILCMIQFVAAIVVLVYAKKKAIKVKWNS